MSEKVLMFSGGKVSMKITEKEEEVEDTRRWERKMWEIEVDDRGIELDREKVKELVEKLFDRLA